MVFEIQQNSDVTFRLYDWDHIDPKTGHHRGLQIDQALACIDFAQDAEALAAPDVESSVPVLREKLFNCECFVLWRLCGESPFMVGAEGMPRILVCIAGTGILNHDGANYVIGKGDVLLLPAVVGACVFRPSGTVSLFEISLPK